MWLIPATSRRSPLPPPVAWRRWIVKSFLRGANRALADLIPLRQQQAPLWLSPATPPDAFPPSTQALADPDNQSGFDGLLALGGDLTSARLLAAYRRGIFPWSSATSPLLWWTPDPRMVLFPDKLRVSRSLQKRLRRNEFQITFDHDFDRVIRQCGAPRQIKQQVENGTWISAAMITAYGELHRLGYAHSVECWQEGELVGGLYGIALGTLFYGESMFARRTDASKVAFVTLVKQLQQRGVRLIDCQIYSDHLASLGAELISRAAFEHYLPSQVADCERLRGSWRAFNGRSDV
ncbi:MAG: leucyl/phenylalanyl-tRNA--protein transferase [Gammaproteobacteria bacterium]|nr:leucyl/phenylalanyl-tRNA--protein transferase [Gammaproteobacteria bacterium]